MVIRISIFTVFILSWDNLEGSSLTCLQIKQVSEEAKSGLLLKNNKITKPKLIRYGQQSLSNDTDPPQRDYRMKKENS